ncbi:MAG: 1-(5-phosphoribosyl)-5-[(5-phosphoribosylamino)methylideneamino]imidazole-4-carboxamide isomerase [Beduini sp.]|uniref:1-(5-phosphoribosyl)-5-[(5- phosphoribosylamino)methylideneamino]imidazole-4- carboxamide isomerase n=1 Tax=Beduini sp. TaxID=1922300 RepID=UPI0039A3E551
MLILPAIDLKDGKVVRLFKGDYQKETIYALDAVEIASYYEKIGADFLHLVDLNGAKEGCRINQKTIASIREHTQLPIELGGGIRDKETIAFYLEKLKIDRIILGTVALKNKPLLKEALQLYGAERIVVGVDIKDGCVATEGWLDTSKVDYLTFLKELEGLRVRYVVVTDISKDGTLSGPNFELYEKIRQETQLKVIVSGGISCKEDVYQVKDNYGCIIGKAFYDGKIDLEEVIACLKKESFPV